MDKLNGKVTFFFGGNKLLNWALLIQALMVLVFIYGILFVFDENVVIKAIKGDDNYEYQSYVNEQIFRDSIYSVLSKDYGQSKIDTTNSEFIKFKIISLLNSNEDNKIKSGFFNFFGEGINDYSTGPNIVNLFYEIISVDEVYSINVEKFSAAVLNNIATNEFETLIEYGNYLEKDFNVERSYRLDRLIVVLFGMITFLLLIYFYFKYKKKEDEEKKTEQIKSDLGKLKDSLNDSDTKVSEGIDKMSKEGKDVSGSTVIAEGLTEMYLAVAKINKILPEEDNVSVLDSMKLELLNRSQNLYNRSFSMLYLGLGVAVLGIVVFYISLPDMKNENLASYISTSVRPFFVLLFIESISIYLLKQYRVSMNDYTYYFNKYLKKVDVSIVSEILDRKDLSEKDREIIIQIITNEASIVNLETEIKNTDKSDLSKVVVSKLLE